MRNAPSTIGAKQKYGLSGCSRTGWGKRKFDGWQRIAAPVGFPPIFPCTSTHLGRVWLPSLRVRPSLVRKSPLPIHSRRHRMAMPP